MISATIARRNRGLWGPHPGARFFFGRRQLRNLMRRPLKHPRAVTPVSAGSFVGRLVHFLCTNGFRYSLRNEPYFGQNTISLSSETLRTRKSVIQMSIFSDVPSCWTDRLMYAIDPVFLKNQIHPLQRIHLPLLPLQNRVLDPSPRRTLFVSLIF